MITTLVCPSAAEVRPAAQGLDDVRSTSATTAPDASVRPARPIRSTMRRAPAPRRGTRSRDLVEGRRPLSAPRSPARYSRARQLGAHPGTARTGASGRRAIAATSLESQSWTHSTLPFERGRPFRSVRGFLRTHHTRRHNCLDGAAAWASPSPCQAPPGTGAARGDDQ